MLYSDHKHKINRNYARVCVRLLIVDLHNNVIVKKTIAVNIDYLREPHLFKKPFYNYLDTKILSMFSLVCKELPEI